MPVLTVQSSAFRQGEQVPVKYSGDGEDKSPPLSWSGVPAEAKELALIMDDPDAPTPQPWVHWVLYKIPPGTTSLPEGIGTATERLASLGGALQGKNSWNKYGYGGPLPPKGHGRHRYYFKLYALDRDLSLPPGTTKERLLAAMQGHILAQGELMGTFQR